MTYPDFIICSKCQSRYDTRQGHHPDSFDEGICPKCGWHLKKEYKKGGEYNGKTRKNKNE